MTDGLPFSPSDFFAVFARYNERVWPAQIILYLLGVAAVALAFRRSSRSTRLVYLILAFFWLWMGVVYHLRFFAAINPAATGFAAAFVIQSILFFAMAARPGVALLDPRMTPAGLSGGILLMGSLVVYPVLTALANHRYPAQPTFGLPCPTTIFTLGLLLWGIEALPRRVVVVPLLWAGIATFATIQLGVVEDLLLTASAVVFIAVFIRARAGAKLIAYADDLRARL
jgi:hypothetical protein